MQNLSINPTITKTASPLYRIDFTGYIQGKPNDTPNLLDIHLSSGYIAAGQTLPLWQGTPVKLLMPDSYDSRLGLSVVRAEVLTEIDGFIVETQNGHAIQTMTNEFPILLEGYTANYVRNGSKVQIPVPAADSIFSGGGGLPGKRIGLSDINLTFDVDLTSATYGKVIAGTGDSGKTLKDLGFKVVGWNYRNSKIIKRATPTSNWGVNTAFEWDNSGSVIVLEI